MYTIDPTQTRRPSSTSEYYAWWNMLERCNRPTNPRYYNYGGRGITVCAEWTGNFPQFLADMGIKPSRDHSIERIDNEKGYSKENCKWATRSEQNRNTRQNNVITWNGEAKPAIVWAEITGIPRDIIRHRVGRLKWDIEKALTTPVDHSCYRPRKPKSI